jgi:thioredoxin 1
MKQVSFFLSGLAFLLFALPAMASDISGQIPVPGMVTMVDLGANKCIPCKMMAPILKKLTRKYEGVAAIIFIDVWEDRNQGRKFGIKSIPTQIFYDEKGKEVFRHQGFMAEEAIIAKLTEMGVPIPVKKK